jgi:hypothetical protein
LAVGSLPSRARDHKPGVLAVSTVNNQLGGGLSSTQWGLFSLNVMGKELLAWGVTTDTLYKE